MVFLNYRHPLPSQWLVTIAPASISALIDITLHPLRQVRDKLLLLCLSSTSAPIDFKSIFSGSRALSDHHTGMLLSLKQDCLEAEGLAVHAPIRNIVVARRVAHHLLHRTVRLVRINDVLLSAARRYLRCSRHLLLQLPLGRLLIRLARCLSVQQIGIGFGNLFSLVEWIMVDYALT
jgi:hypothetical protein